MYPSVRDSPVAPRPGRWSGVARNVILLGLTSLFTDISAEMLTAVLPLYLALELHMTPLQIGLIDGLYQAASAVVRVAAGMVADARRRYKTVAVVGYALSAVCRAGLIVAGGSLAGITSLLMIDRVGKGIRTAPRDALITLSSPPAQLGAAFGAHRALDTIGAVLGPVFAFGLLAMASSAYDAVFVVSLAFAIVGLAIVTLFVRNQVPLTPPDATARRAGLREIGRHRGFVAVLGAGVGLSVMTSTDALIYLMLQRSGAVEPSIFPLFFVGTALVYLVLALPLGRLADRVGRHVTFVAGHLAVMAIYLTLVVSPVLPRAGVVACVALLGVYYAATDGVLAALAAAALPEAQVTTGLAIVSTAVALSRLAAAALFGALWNAAGIRTALAIGAVGLGIAVSGAIWWLRPGRRSAAS
ncbi:MAG: hypothetical protein ABS36_17440 [Acidobacteria bacterium SCN 69-37]|nr:MAG: hypothetical protein ABS36_17440 [Acidobacteria bacterium SCN 69-37]